MNSPRKTDTGFTLIELSIVLVIIGLIAGGVLIGQDLIRAAYVRAQISQIEKFNTAVNTFYGKYQSLPGDMTNATAATYGFSSSIHNASSPAPSGQGDGNGTIDPGSGEGGSGGPGFNMTFGYSANYGETAVFWVDLSSAAAGNLIEGGFTLATESITPSIALGTALQQYLPPAKLGGGDYVYVFELGGINYYGVENVSSVSTVVDGIPGMSVMQAYNIDKKIDDGLPTTGRVAAMVTNGGEYNWSIGGNASQTFSPAGSLFSGVVQTSLSPGPLNCFDAASGTAPTYALEQNNGSGINCALIFRFQ